MDTLKAIRTFCQVVDSGSFSETARQLNLAVSAISRQIVELEKHFDCKLLYRTTRVMRLTPEGEFFEQQFRQILAQVDDLEHSIIERQQRIEGKLRITSPQNIGLSGINPQIASFLKQHPRVDLSWVMINRYVNLIEEGYDLAIRAGSLDDSSFVSRRYRSFRLKYAASPDYLADNGIPTHPRELKHHQCLLDNSLPTPERLPFYEQGEVKQVSVQRHFALNQGHLLVDFAEAGLGICHLPDFLLEDAINTGRLRPILEEFWQPPIDIYFVYPASKLSSPVVRTFIDHLLAET